MIIQHLVLYGTFSIATKVIFRTYFQLPTGCCARGAVC